MNILNVILVVLVFVSGCTSFQGPRGRGSINPFSANYDADAAMSSCIASRRSQRHELLCDAGIIRGSRCGGETEIAFRDAFRVICEQSRLSEENGEDAVFTREECVHFLTQIPAGATGTVPSEVPTTTDPMMQRIIAMNPALWQDDHAFCVAITTDYGSPRTARGVGLGGGVPLGVGVPGVVGSIGIGVHGSIGAGSVGVPDTREYVIDNQISNYLGGPEGGTRTVSISGQILARGNTTIRIPDVREVVLTFECSNRVTFNRTVSAGTSMGYTSVHNQHCNWSN